MGLILNIGSRNSTYEIVEPDATINLAQNDIINVQNGNGIVQGFGVNSDHIDIDGEVHVTGGSGLRILGLANTITAGFDSIITAPIGIWLLNGSTDSGLDRNTLLTEGQIVATEVGIRNEDFDTAIRNLGTLRADKAIVGVTYGLNLTNMDLATIEGGSRGIDLSGITDTSQRTSIVNSGTISGDIAIVGGRAQESVINHGVISGNVQLGAGNDFFDGRGGTVDGVVQGGDNNDTYIVDSRDINLQEQANGGTGDTVESTVSYTLHSNFENLFLLGSAKINAIGNTEANNLHGNSAANILKGGAGRDVLFGGKGNDILFGNADADHFIFDKRFGHDTVKDLAAGGREHDVIDLSDFESISSFADLANHHIRQNGHDVIIEVGHHNTIRLEDLDRHDLHANDFLFASG